jgi:hypothetical protein
MSAEPTEEQEKYYDMTMDLLEDIVRHIEATVIAMGEGDFEVAVEVMKQGASLTDGTVWETATKYVTKCKTISDELSKEDN